MVLQLKNPQLLVEASQLRCLIEGHKEDTPAYGCQLFSKMTEN